MSLQFLYNCKARGQFSNYIIIKMALNNVIYVAYTQLFTTNKKAPTLFLLLREMRQIPRWVLSM